MVRLAKHARMRVSGGKNAMTFAPAPISLAVSAWHRRRSHGDSLTAWPIFEPVHRNTRTV
jgi:hypothetical protein